MQDNSVMVLRIHELTSIEQDVLAFIISHIKGTLTIEVKCPSIGSTQSYRDVAADLLDALYIGETIAEFCKDITSYRGRGENDDYRQTVNFVLTPQNSSELAKKLYWLSFIFSDIDENEMAGELREAVLNFEEQILSLQKSDYHFPLLADDYFANFIIGCDEDGDMPEEILDLNKEDLVQVQNYLYQNHSYILSIYWQSLHYELYSSSTNDSWIIFSSTPIELSILEQMLAIYVKSLFHPLELQEASVIGGQNFDMIAFNNVEAVTYPFQQLTKMQECVADIYQIKNGVPIDSANTTKVTQHLLSSYGDILIVVDQVAQYVFFRGFLSNVPEEVLKKLAQRAIPLKAYLKNLPQNLEQRTQNLVAYNKMRSKHF